MAEEEPEGFTSDFVTFQDEFQDWVSSQSSTGFPIPEDMDIESRGSEASAEDLFKIPSQSSDLIRIPKNQDTWSQDLSSQDSVKGDLDFDPGMLKV